MGRTLLVMESYQGEQSSGGQGVSYEQRWAGQGGPLRQVDFLALGP